MKRMLLLVVLEAAVISVIGSCLPLVARETQADKTERLRIKVMIDRALLEQGETYLERSEKDVAPITNETVPVLMDFALDQDRPLQFREEAMRFLKAVPDDRILAPFIEYYHGCLQKPNEPCELASLIYQTFANYYVKSKDERALTPFVEMLTSDTSPGAAKHDAVKMLGLCRDRRPGEILKRLVINNPSYPWEYHKALAAGAIADSGDDSVLPQVIEYASFVLEEHPSDASGHGLALLEGIRSLVVLAKRNDLANAALMRLAEQFVADKSRDYICRGELYPVFGESVIPALAEVKRVEDVRLIEQLLGRCNQDVLIRQMIKVLGEAGDERTIGVLEGYGGHPDAVSQAISRIRDRISGDK